MLECFLFLNNVLIIFKSSPKTEYQHSLWLSNSTLKYILSAMCPYAHQDMHKEHSPQHSLTIPAWKTSPMHCHGLFLFFFFFCPALSRYTWQIKFYIFKEYNVVIRYTYTLWNDYPIGLINTSITSHSFLFCMCGENA